MIIDPVLDYDADSGRMSHTNMDKLLQYVRDNNLTVEWVLETHVHADHITSASDLRKVLGGHIRIGIGAGVTKVQETFRPIYNLKTLRTDGSQFDKLFHDGDEIQVGNMKLRALYTPGHTSDSTCFFVHNLGIFLGDTMFQPDLGTARCDFPNGSAELLHKSIQKILSYPDDTKLFVCHDYPKNREFTWQTTVGEEKAKNIHLQPGQDFVHLRTTRDATLKIPHLLLPSIQLNLEAGQVPAAEENGVSYIKIPLNYFK